MRDMAAEMADPALTRPDGGLLPIDLRGVTLEISGKPLIRALDLSLAGSGITMIMGPNGAGKSLLLRLLHGLVAPTSGQITMGGRPLTRDILRRQALVFQTPVLLRRSVAANLDFVLRARRATADRDALLRRVGLADKTGQPARLLSGGEQQRLALARALATAPDLLLLDEPTASLDPASVLMIETIVRDVEARGTRVVFVSHDIGQARRLADEVVFLTHGQVVEHSRAADFFQSPRSEAGRAYLDGRLVL